MAGYVGKYPAVALTSAADPERLTTSPNIEASVGCSRSQLCSAEVWHPGFGLWVQVRHWSKASAERASSPAAVVCDAAVTAAAHRRGSVVRAPTFGRRRG